MRMLFLLSLLVSFSLSAQDYSGDWEGTILKVGNETPFYYAITVSQEQHKVKGWSEIAYQDTTWNAQKKWVGYAGKNRLQIIENEFITHNHELGAYWLLIRGVLKYDKGEDKLSGWVDAYDPYTKSFLSTHDYVILYRKKQKVAYEKGVIYSIDSNEFRKSKRAKFAAKRQYNSID